MTVHWSYKKKPTQITGVQNAIKSCDKWMYSVLCSNFPDIEYAMDKKLEKITLQKYKL